MSEKITFTAKILSSLSKVFLDEEPMCDPACLHFTALQNEVFSFVTAYAHSDWLSPFAKVRIQSPLAQYIHVREVCNVPSAQPVRAWQDDNYLRTEPGVYPDLLVELEDNRVLFSACRWKSLWIDVQILAGGPHGIFDISVVFESPDGEELCRASTSLTVYNVALGPQRLIRSEWFHGDCLANYYGETVFSARHWDVMESFITAAARRGCNMILTPQFTPPLDTAPLGERTTIQLIDVKVNADNTYTFGFDKLKQWVDLCLRAKMKYFEMSHLFTQWGAEHAPKIMAEKNGEIVQIFGWDTDAAGQEYTRFLSAYLPQLTEKLHLWGIADVTRFHISDEPEASQLKSYCAARSSVQSFLQGFVIMDALSDIEIFRQGAIDCPVCSNDHIQPFIDAEVSPLWSYYCTAQFMNVSNRFMSMPSARCRIYGTQAFLYKLEGILHWGYNFYNSKHSVYALDPYRCTDAGGVFPSGDAFLVYPGKNGMPEESIRMMNMCHAMQDARALAQLADIKGHNFVKDLLTKGLPCPITFDNYPKSDLWLLNMRNEVNRLLSELV